MYKLRSNDNLDFAALDGLRSGINQLTWSALLLGVGSSLRKQEMLIHGLTSDMTRPQDERIVTPTSRPSQNSVSVI
jgi:hypothetical protein